MSTEKSKLTREEVAKIEIGHTNVSRGMVWTFTIVFLSVIFLIPTAQILHEKGISGVLRILEAPGHAAKVFAESEGSFFHRLLTGNSSLLRDIHIYEDNREKESFLTKILIPPVQLFMARYLGAGNEKAYIGHDNWLFFRPSLDYLTGLGFLDPTHLARRATSSNEWTAAPQPDPRKAILNFRDQLAERDIALVLLPIPVKPGVHPERFSRRYQSSNSEGPLHNASFDDFVEELLSEGVLICTLDEELKVSSKDKPQYLVTDTHWRPETMVAAAQRLGNFINENLTLPPVPEPGYKRLDQVVSSQGDLALMMKLPENQELFEAETVQIQQVLNADDYFWHPNTSADVLLLGDSFSNIYSLESMDWGSSAGLAEQLSFLLQRPVDAIVRNDAGAYATREVLSRDLIRGKDRLEGKRVVIWEFAERELAVGDWKMLNLTLGTPEPAQFITPKESQSLLVTGIVEGISRAPRPGSVPYKDHIIAVHLCDLETVEGSIKGGQALVYMWSMRDNVWTDAAWLRERQQITLRLSSWYEVAYKYEAINRAELDDENLQFEDPCWGKLLIQGADK